MAIENIGKKAPAELKLDNYAKGFLKETAKWTKFLSILGFVFIGLFVLNVIYAMIFGDQTSSSPGMEFTVTLEGGPVGGIIALIILGIYFVPVYYLYLFSTKMQRALLIEDEDTLTRSFEYLKSHYKFIGIMTIILLGLMILLFFIGLIGYAANT